MQGFRSRATEGTGSARQQPEKKEPDVAAGSATRSRRFEALHQQRAPCPQQFAVGGSQLLARCGQLDCGRREALLELRQTLLRGTPVARWSTFARLRLCSARFPTSAPGGLFTIVGSTFGASTPVSFRPRERTVGGRPLSLLPHLFLPSFAGRMTRP